MVTTSVLHGMEAILVQVEADVSPGLPTFEMVGFLSSEVKEAKERVRTALRNCGYQLPAKRITISFSPAGIRKSGSGFDLAVAVAILAALEAVPKKRVENTIFRRTEPEWEAGSNSRHITNGCSGGRSRASDRDRSV
ncbi:MAG: magnesium chelatase domain-containing protein [Clostridia bacterium]